MNTTEIGAARELTLDILQRELAERDWPKCLYVTPAVFWDCIRLGVGEVNWHFLDETDGFSFFILGPTMVRTHPQSQQGTATLGALKEVEDERIESEEVETTSVRAEDEVDEGGLLPVTPASQAVRGYDDVSDDGPETDESE